MPGKFEGYETRLASFNKKYNVNFSFEQYDSQSLKTKNLADPLKNSKNISRENLKYRNALLNIYKECVRNMIDKKSNTFKPEDLAANFENLMDSYRKYCNDNDMDAPDVNGGWTGTETIDAMRSTLNSIRPQRVAHETERYLSGELRVRDVRSYVRTLAQTGIRDINADSLSNIIVYRDAIKNAVESRSIWWKIRHPFKNSAEQKAVQVLNELIDINTAYAFTAQALVDGEAINDAKNALDSATNHIEAELNARDPQRAKMNMDFLSEGANVRNVSPKIEKHPAPQKENVNQL